MKFKIGDKLVITKDNVLNNGVVYDGAMNTVCVVVEHDPDDDTYLLAIEKGFDHFEENGLVWVKEDNLDYASSIKPYFTPVVDKHRKHPNVELIYPRMGSQDAIACDFFSPVDMVIKPFESGMIWLDFKAIFPRSLALIMNVRSSMGKQPIMLANTQGWIECDYANNKDNDGNLGVRLFNLGKEDYVIKQGDRIAQGMFVEVHRAKGTETNNKRVGGHGSTGK